MMNKKILISIIVIMFVIIGVVLFLILQKPASQSKCGDGICGEKELANPNLCPGDCVEADIPTKEITCPRLMPPSPQLKEECEKDGGKLKSRKNKNGCYFGYDCEKETTSGNSEDSPFAVNNFGVIFGAAKMLGITSAEQMVEEIESQKIPYFKELGIKWARLHPDIFGSFGWSEIDSDYD